MFAFETKRDMMIWLNRHNFIVAQSGYMRKATHKQTAQYICAVYLYVGMEGTKFLLTPYIRQKNIAAK